MLRRRRPRFLSIETKPGLVIEKIQTDEREKLQFQLSYAVGWHLDRKYPKVMRLQAEIAVETVRNRAEKSSN